MKNIKIDNQHISVPSYYTIFQAIQELGIQIPHFCFHERLSIAGNCRMCLVEIRGYNKPMPSCAINIFDLKIENNDAIPEIFTNTKMIIEARKGVMEFLLINHPLDCPICDQGGECDLQDQAMIYGRDFSRYREKKRSIKDKYIGPLIKTFMTRCIYCTRCIRFSTEIAGISELGMIGRGEDARVVSYLEKSVTSELQGNMIDLCPVGAITSRPYAFHARPWELIKTESIDVMDALGSAIVVNTRGRNIIRILPRLNNSINEEWISDKTRFICDGLRMQRIDRPYIRNSQGKLITSNWKDALNTIKYAIEKSKDKIIGAIAGDLATVEELYALKILLKNLNSSYFDCRQDLTTLNPIFGRASYIFNPTISGIDNSDALLIIGSNPRFEASILNTRILQRYRKGKYPIGVIGEKDDFIYPYTYLGNGTKELCELCEGKGDFFKILKKSLNPIILIGQGALINNDGIGILSKIAQLAISIGAISENWNGFGILHTAASRVGALDIGFINKFGLSSKDIIRHSSILLLLGADEIDLREKNGFTIYIGSHGDNGANFSDVVLPASTYIEKSGIYINTEGRVQMTNKAGFAPGDAKEDWEIICILSEIFGYKLPFSSLIELRRKLFDDYPHFDKINSILPGKIQDIISLAQKNYSIKEKNFILPIKDFYQTNPIARASITMSKCSSFKYNNKSKNLYNI